MTVTKKTLARLFCVLFIGFGIAACTAEVQEDPGASGGAEAGSDADADHSHADGDADHSHDDSGENK